MRSSDCTTCNGTSFDGLESSTYIDTQQVAPSIKYLDGSSVSGNYSIDVITFGNLTLPVKDDQSETFRFMEAHTTSEDLFDGVVGLAMKQNRGQNDLLFNHFRESGQLDEEVFCYWINSDLTEAELIFGGIDYSRLNSDITWISALSDDAHWSATLGEIVIPQSNGICSSSFNSWNWSYA